MKTRTTIFTLICLSAFIFSCNKYEDGPFISFKSVEKRIAGDYNVDKYMINGEVISLTDQGISQYRVVYNEDGTGKTYITINSSEQISDFEWETDEKNEKIRERFLGLNQEWSAWSEYNQIKRLTKDEFWVVNIASSDTTEFHFIEQ
jgi:hypothetical protein